MAWRQIKKEDIKLGALILMPKMVADGSYGICTIISIHDRPEYGIENPKNFWAFVKVARPMAYAHQFINENQPLLTVEVFEIGINHLLQEGDDFQVFQGRDEIRSLTT